MRIVDRAEFLQLPQWTLYAKISGGVVDTDGLEVKTAQMPGSDDWVAVDFDLPDYDDTDQLVEMWRTMSADASASYPLNPLGQTSRDGLYEGDDVRFMVYEPSDIADIIDVLQRCQAQVPS